MQNQNPTSVSFSVTDTSSLLQIYKPCALNSLFLHTIIYIHFIITITSLILRGDVKVFFFCFKSVTSKGSKHFYAFWWEGACRQVLSVLVGLGCFCQNPMTARRHLFLSWKAPVAWRLRRPVQELLLCWWLFLQKGTDHERKLSNQSVNRNLIFFSWVILYPACRALDRVIHLAQKSTYSEDQWNQQVVSTWTEQRSKVKVQPVTPAFPFLLMKQVFLLFFF